MTEQLIKDHPDLVKDSKSGAILLKRPKNITNIEIDNLKKRVSKLEAENEDLKSHLSTIYDTLSNQNKIISDNMNHIKDLYNKLSEQNKNIRDNMNHIEDLYGNVKFNTTHIKELFEKL